MKAGTQTADAKGAIERNNCVGTTVILIGSESAPRLSLRASTLKIR